MNRKIKCTATRVYTWSQRGQRSAIDFILVSPKLYERLQSVEAQFFHHLWSKIEKSFEIGRPNILPPCLLVRLATINLLDWLSCLITGQLLLPVQTLFLKPGGAIYESVMVLHIKTLYIAFMWSIL